ncbi:MULTISPECIES: hypothetical protein [Dethiosulfovibrio]|uniref:Uncharacterized protein n=2 Tax=Dethiosulfovibrio TaxID=47054 RepID=A0ABS9ES44_9BACT|nr:MULTISPECIES: hypothetical protein [Dethiosulfovibrio]MCF4114709.1 hypothetical protein [Dethiosulfovibrio russensis]MCF4143086.1 hypothetical protein [Dethiosulfovibrio marinus]MCF4145214.1 hypothetical protein [Dethiosulfovibrio acidaminovorans]
MRLIKAIERKLRHYRKGRWYEVNMGDYARRTLLKVIDGDIRSCLRDQITLDQADVLYSMAGRS